MSENHILLVEDNPDDLLLTKHAFKKCKTPNTSYTIETAQDGEKAINYLQSNTLPQLILLDLKLPKKDGFQVLKYIRSHGRTQTIPVIILSSSTEEKDITKAYTLGANSYIHKPINMDYFYSVIQNICYYWLKLNEHPT